MPWLGMRVHARAHAWRLLGSDLSPVVSQKLWVPSQAMSNLNRRDVLRYSAGSVLAGAAVSAPLAAGAAQGMQAKRAMQILQKEHLKIKSDLLTYAYLKGAIFPLSPRKRPRETPSSLPMTAANFPSCPSGFRSTTTTQPAS